MKLQLITLQSVMDTHGVSLADRPRVAYTAVARAVAYTLPMATTKLHSAETYFDEKFCSEVNNVLEQVNEAYPIRIEDACALIKQLWLFRYYLVWEPSNPSVSRHLDDIARMGDRNLNPRYQELLSRCEPVLLRCSQLLCDAITAPPEG